MQDREFSKREAEDELEWIASGEELEAYLEHIAPYIGWITIYFNSLEDHISDFIRMAVLRDPFQDERLDVFLSGMMFAGKAQALIDLYGQMIASAAVQKTDKELKELQKLLQECAQRRSAQPYDVSACVHRLCPEPHSSHGEASVVAVDHNHRASTIGRRCSRRESRCASLVVGTWRNQACVGRTAAEDCRSSWCSNILPLN
jgi:hypothetical protein